MRKLSYLSSLLLTGVSAAVLSGCATLKSASREPDSRHYQNEFASTNVFSRSFPGSERETCEAARRALLSQGYIISEATAALVKGRKNFQPNSDVHTQIEFHVVCAPNSKGSNSTTAFANAVRDRYSLRKSSNSASVGVGVLGSLSVPFGSTDDSLVKVASETIPTRQFYERFFELLEAYLDYPAAGAAEEAEGQEVRPAAPSATNPDADF
jgi:hypothetical protein